MNWAQVRVFCDRVQPLWCCMTALRKKAICFQHLFSVLMHYSEGYL